MNGRWIVIYDANCAFCRRQIDKIKKHDRLNLFEYIPNDTLDLVSKFPQLEGKDLNANLWLIDRDGKLYAATDAVYQIMRQLPKYKLFAPLYRLPFIHSAAKWAYKWIAAHRQ